MDLEARTRDFFAAHADLEPDRILPFLSPQVRVEYVGALEALDRAGIERMLRAMHTNLGALGMKSVRFAITGFGSRRNVVFVQWSCQTERKDRPPAMDPGVHIITWDRDGQAVDIKVYTDVEKIRHLAVGAHAEAARVLT